MTKTVNYLSIGVDELRNLAKKDDRTAMFHLARYHLDGYDRVKIDREVAARMAWDLAQKGDALGSSLSFLIERPARNENATARLRQSTALRADLVKLAEAGNMFAQNFLGSIISCDIEDERAASHLPSHRQRYDWMTRESEAAQYHRKAAAQGNPVAFYNLAIRFVVGRGAAEHPELAIENLTLAAKAGLARAQYLLGFAYQKGEGVPEDTAKANEWFQRAAKQGHKAAALECLDAKPSTGGPELPAEAAQDHPLALVVAPR